MARAKPGKMVTWLLIVLMVILCPISVFADQDTEIPPQPDYSPSEQISGSDILHGSPHYIVTLQNEDGTLIGIILVTEGASIESAPDAQEQDGKVFKEWKDSNSNPVTFPYTPADDVTLTADYADAWTVTFYTYEKDENGNLILDENGNPIVTVVEGDRSPVAYMRDDRGALILNENGNPIPVQTVPLDAVKMLTLDDVLTPERHIDVYSSWDNQQPAFGGTVHFIAIPVGYDGVEYKIQWQTSSDSINWSDISGADELDYYLVVTEENYMDYWRVELTITGILNDIGKSSE